MKLSKTGARLIKTFEGFRSGPYRDAVGVWTIGYGSTKGVGPDTRHVTRAQAEARLMREVDATYGASINRLRLPLNQNQFDALVSFIYNVGPGGVATSTGIGRALRRHKWKTAADELLKWDKAGGRTLLGLTRRRRAERAMFLKAGERDHLKADERRWVDEYDDLKRKNHNRARRVVLRRTMARRRSVLLALPQTSGRKRRQRTLGSRSGGRQ